MLQCFHTILILTVLLLRKIDLLSMRQERSKRSERFSVVLSLPCIAIRRVGAWGVTVGPGSVHFHQTSLHGVVGIALLVGKNLSETLDGTRLWRVALLALTPRSVRSRARSLGKWAH